MHSRKGFNLTAWLHVENSALDTYRRARSSYGNISKGRMKQDVEKSVTDALSRCYGFSQRVEIFSMGKIIKQLRLFSL